MSSEQYIKTTCSVDCPDNCAMIATVKDGRLIKVKGNPEQPHTGNLLCAIGYRQISRLYHPDRLLYPQKRVDGKWQRITWDEALDTIVAKIKFFQEKYGSGSIMHFQRNGSWQVSQQIVFRFFNLLGGTTNTKGSLCSGAAMAAQAADMGARVGNDIEEILNSKTIIIWGRDPYKSSIHYVTYIKLAKKRGAKVITIDPILTKTAVNSDVHIRPNPGSDGYLAMGIAKEILELGLEDAVYVKNFTNGYDEYLSLLKSFTMDEIVEKCGISAEQIRQLAESYGRQKPASILLGYGINKWESSVEIIRLIDALGAITGNIGKSGGGINHGFEGRRFLDKRVLAPEAAKFRRDIPEPLFGQGILEAKDPPIKMLWVNLANPVISCPNSNKVVEALKSLDFIVVVEQFMTDTADYAHILLPATTFFEDEEDVVISWGHNWIGPVNRVVEPLGESKSNLHIVQELAEKLGMGELMRGTTKEWLKKILQPMENAGLSVDQVFQAPARLPETPTVAFHDNKFRTKSGKYEFIRKFYKERKSEYPYHFLPILATQWINSDIVEERHPKTVKVLINQNLAREKSIRNGSRVLVKSKVGQLPCEVEVTEKVPDKTCVIYHGTWMKKGGGNNRLVEDIQSTSGNMAAFNSTKVDIELLEDTKRSFFARLFGNKASS